ncbi:MAG: ROK family protein [Chloroflexota bacterium]|nr:ROK family protein [Chloroflexota bacterium]
MSKKKQMIVGVDLGGSKINAVLADAEGNIEARNLRETLAEEGPDAVIGRIVESVQELASGAGVVGVGIGAAGAHDAGRGLISFSPNLPGWNDIPLCEAVRREVGLPVYLENDAAVAALGERRFGGGAGVDNLIYVGLGTGIGGGIIIDGKLYSGACGAAGEIGHMIVDDKGPRCKCGNNGCWEVFASGWALAEEAAKQIEAGVMTAVRRHVGGDASKVTAKAVFEAAQDGDYVAHELVSRAAYYVGVGLVNLVNIFNPELILVGGGLANMGELLLEPAMEVVRERAFQISARTVRVELARLGADAGTLGAVALVLDRRAGGT